MMELPVETRIYEIAPAFAKGKGLPCYFAARPIIQTKKAAYLVGRGTTRTTHIGVCMSCGRALTHPVSVELGIGPECGKHFWDWDLIGGYNKENLERLKSKVLEIEVDGWFPKAVVRQLYETDDHVTVPEDHPMLKPKDKANGGGKKAVQVTYKSTGNPAVKITFPFDRDILDKVKSLSGRRFHNEGRDKYWTCPLSIDSVNALKDWGFELDQKLENFLAKAQIKLEDIKIPLDFSLCPLYFMGLGNNLTLEVQNAKGSLPTQKTARERSGNTGNNQSQLSKRPGTGGPQKSYENASRTREGRDLEGSGVRSHKTSDAPPRNKGKTPERIGTSPKEIWSQFQRWQRTGNDANGQTCEQIIVSLWLHKGISNPNQTCEGQVQKCTECLQSRFWTPGRQDCNRTGRAMSPGPRGERKRSKEDHDPTSPWVDCNTLAALNSLFIIPGLKRPLYKFQLEDVLWLEQKDGRALNASEMGLGKTAQALAWLQLHPEKRPAVVVVPASLKLNWAKEARMWLQNPGVQVLHGSKPNTPITGDIIIINYDILNGWFGALQKIKARVLIADEVHFIKNSKAQRTKAVLALGKGVPHIIGLSGTPIVNRPVEAINAIKLVDTTVIGSPWKFKQRYCGAYHNGWGWDFSGATNTEELHEKLVNTIMIRRKKADVLTDLPDKIRSFLPMELDNTREYDKAENDFVEWVRGIKGDKAAERVSNAEQLAKIEALKQLAVKGKLKQAISWIRDFIDTDGKLVVFAVHKFVIDALMKEFGDLAVKVDGSVTGQARQDAVDRFQEDDSCRLFIGNVKAAGVGLTLTAASNVAFLELPWAPGDVSQAEDRCHRIGQKDSVSIYYLLAAGSIEEQIAKLLDKKRKILDKVLDGEETDAGSLLGELMDSYSKTA